MEVVCGHLPLDATRSEANTDVILREGEGGREGEREREGGWKRKEKGQGKARESSERAELWEILCGKITLEHTPPPPIPKPINTPCYVYSSSITPQQHYTAAAGLSYVGLGRLVGGRLGRVV